MFYAYTHDVFYLFKVSFEMGFFLLPAVTSQKEKSNWICLLVVIVSFQEMVLGTIDFM